MSRHLAVNDLAMEYVQQMIAHRNQLNVLVEEVAGATLIDCGIRCRGGWQAGLLFAKACLGGLAQVTLTWSRFGELNLPAVEVRTDFPREACMASQYAGWFLKTQDYQGMGSGPVRAAIHEEELFQQMDYRDSHSSAAVLCLEAAQYPTPAVVELLREKTGRSPGELYILVAPTASAAGLVQIAARSVETGLHKMVALGYDLHKVEGGMGIAPLAPASKNDFQALGRTNDAILYGATVSYAVEDQDPALEDLARQLPSSASRDYGQLFAQLWERYGNFYDIDPMLFSPARVWLHNQASGRTFRGGEIREDILARSFGMEA